MNLNITEEKIPIGKQLKGVVTDGYWWIIILFYLLFNFSGGLKNLAMSYYCDYVVGTYQDGITQTVLAAVSGIPMAVGIVFIWPLANKFGKKNIIVIGLIISVIGGVISMIAPDNFIMVVIGVMIKTLGTVPACYVMMALFADVLDHLEAKNGYRSDGLSMSIYSVITVAALGIITSVFNGLISVSGYVAPSIVDGVAVAAEQNDATKWIFIICFLGVEVIAYGILVVILNFLHVEKNIVKEQATILERQKAAVIASGGTWVEPEERARLEQIEADRQAEEARIKELRDYCDRKGLSFDEEEQKYQRKLANKKKR
jgi:Na+/melibiose symporter-like transporter